MWVFATRMLTSSAYARRSYLPWICFWSRKGGYLAQKQPWITMLGAVVEILRQKNNLAYALLPLPDPANPQFENFCHMAVGFQGTTY